MKKSVVVFSVALLFSLSVYSQEAVVESEKSSASETVSAEVTSVAEDFSGEIVSDGTADEISVSDEAEVVSSFEEEGFEYPVLDSYN